MKNWFSQLFAQATEQGRNAIRLVLIFIAAAFIVFFATAGLSIASARRNRVELAGILLIALMLTSRLNRY